MSDPNKKSDDVFHQLVIQDVMYFYNILIAFGKK